MQSLNYLMIHMLYQIFKTILRIWKKNIEKTINPSIRICVNKIENVITFKIKTGYYLEFLMPETMKLIGSPKRKIIENEHGQNKLHLEISELVSDHCNIVNNNYQQNSRALYTFVRNKSSIIRYFNQKSYVFKNF